MIFGDGEIRGVQTVVNHGPNSGKWNLVVIGDGYIEADIDTFERDVADFVDELRDTAPFGELWARINIHSITAVSAERGADLSSDVQSANTILGATFFTEQNGTPVPRLLSVDHRTARRIARRFIPEAHQVLVLVNSKDYGGGGGPVAVSSTGPGAFKIAIHEIGHSAFGLADEYESGERARLLDEPAAANITLRESGAKWRDLLTSDPALRVPNPSAPDYDPHALAPPASTVGAFEGALYRPRHVYRPSAECRMRTLADPFCAVCAASIRVKLSGFDRPVAGPRTSDRITVNAMPDLTPDDVPAAIDNRAVVTLEGYVVDTLDDDEIAVITDPWMRDRLIIARDQVVHRIPGADRSSSGESVLWVLRDAPMRRIVTGTAEQFGSGGAGGGTGEAGSGWSPPPPPYPRR